MCPEGAAVVSAVRRLRGSGWIGADDEVVCLNTGAGIIYPEALPVRVGDGEGEVPVVAKDGRLDVRRG